MAITVSGLYYYPVKSCRGIALNEAYVGRMGIQYDRQWMVVDADTGMFVAQRKDGSLGIAVRSMCLVRPAIWGRILVLNAPGMQPLMLSVDGRRGQPNEVQIWKDRPSVVDEGDLAANWFTTFLSREREGNYRLVRMPDDAVRPSKYGDKSSIAFADAAPLLIVSEASLIDLNQRLKDQPVPMNRFRPNIVFTGCGPYEEDLIESGSIYGVQLFGKDLCPRCQTVNIEQSTGGYSLEPLRTLATYRKREDGVVFGRNFIHSGTGLIRVGAVVDVFKWAS